MGQWIYMDREYRDLPESIITPCGKEVDDRFNITLGLEPMKENVFDYLVYSILKKEVYGRKGYLSIAYEPCRPDRLSCIQCYFQVNGEGFSIEVVDNSSHWRGYRSYKKMDVSFTETVNLFRTALVEYMHPDLSGWVDITDSLYCEPNYSDNAEVDYDIS